MVPRPTFFAAPKLSHSRKKRSGSVYTTWLRPAEPAKKTSYVNLTVLDASDAVYGMVRGKVDVALSSGPPRFGPRSVKDKVAHRIAKTASERVTTAEVARKMSEKLPKMLMYKMHHKAGVQLAAEVVFREDCFVVVQVQVQRVDAKKLLAVAKEKIDDSEEGDDANNGGGDDYSNDDNDSVATATLDKWIADQKQLLEEEEESAYVVAAQNAEEYDHHPSALVGWRSMSWKKLIVTFLGWILGAILPVALMRNLEEDRLPSRIQNQIAGNVESMLTAKLAGKGMRAEAVVLSEEEEARYFFAQLRRVRRKPAGGGGGGGASERSGDE